ncbi:mucin-5AC-like [Mizuhopecten yessoensis]|uniref:Uncharacterized protein n=1 Tax=Mizuhopecten yessoensis TaxID=6573 RepID=A0A210PPL8_MIZYE|nr:mucin-5AC-like [Mizuhopecten yessoensis]OWF38449.1 hypothetical protein KP79_PYT11565 [Mizuhopecten yessoensis]
MITMQLMTRTIEVICIIGCLQCVIPLVRALPPEGVNPLDTEIPSIPGSLLGDDLPDLPPATADVTNNAIEADSQGVVFKDSFANPQAPSEVGKSGTVGGVRSFNTNTQVASGSNSEPTVSTQVDGGASLFASSIVNNNLNPSTSTSTSTDQIGTNGFFATVARQPPLPPRMSRVMFSPARAGNTMRLSSSKPRLTNKPFMSTLANQPKRTFNAIQRSSGMVPASAQSLTFPPMNFERPPSMSYLPTSNFAARLRTERRPTFFFRSPEMFQTSFYPPSDQTFLTAPFVGSGSDFSSASFPSTSVNVQTVPPFPLAMPFQNPLDISSAQTFTSTEPPRVIFDSVPQTFAVPQVSRFSQNSGSLSPHFSTFAGPSVQSSTFFNEPKTSVTVLPQIIINDTPSLNPRPPPRAQIRQSSMMTGRTPITVTPLTPLSFDAPAMPGRTSIPVSFQTTPAFRAPNFAPFTLPMRSEGTRMFGFSRVPSIRNQAGGGNIGTPMVRTGAGAAEAGAAAAVRAQGVTNTGGVFSAGIPLMAPLPVPMWSQFNDVGRPILSNIQAF